MKLGIISDTHGFLDPAIFDLFVGVEHILHAGDVGFSSLILELETIAPVTAVCGNTDAGLPLRETEMVVLAGRKFLVHHIVNPHLPSDRLRPHLERQRPDVVVFGHSHKQFCETIGGALFFNPGYAGKPKFGADRSAAILHCDAKEIRHEFLAL
jgi:uncharacterized protein